MRVANIIFLVLLHLPFSANAFDSIKDIFAKEFPADILWLFWKNPEQSKILKRLNKPDLQEKNKHYYALHDFKYSLEITYDNAKKISSIDYRTNKTKLCLNDLMSFIKKNRVQPYPTTGHQEGRYIAAFIPSLGIKLIFNNNSRRELYRIQLSKEWNGKK